MADVRKSIGETRVWMYRRFLPWFSTGLAVVFLVTAIVSRIMGERSDALLPFGVTIFMTLAAWLTWDVSLTIGRLVEPDEEP